MSERSSARKHGFFPAAGVEYVEAAEHYAEGDRERGLRFEAAVNHAIARILEHPEIGVVIRKRAGVVFRKWRVPRFRYNLIYIVLDDAIRIYAVAHHSRRPGYWLRRIRVP